MKKVKFGLIGCGEAANFHSIAGKRIKSEYDNIEYNATYDIDEKSAKKVAKRLKTTPYTDIDEFLSSDINAVIVMVPHFLHLDLVKAAAEAGKHVLCEKPMAPTLEECNQMIEVTKKAGVKFMIAENHRFLPAHKKVKELVENGFIGDVYLGRSYEGAFCPYEQFMDNNSWHFTYAKGGGGVLADQGVHKFATLNWMLGEVESGYAWLGKTHDSPVEKGEDNAIMLLRYQNGAMIEVQLSSTAVHPLNNNLELHGTKGHILEDHSWANPVKIMSSHPDAEKKGEYYDISVEHGEYPKYYTISAYHEDLHFAQCLLNDVEPEFTPEQARDAVKVVLLGYMSAKEGRSITMNEFDEYTKLNDTKTLLERLGEVTQKNYSKLNWN